MTDSETSPQFVDTHAHLNDDQFAGDARDVVRRAASRGVSRIVNVAFSRSMWDAAVALSASMDGVISTAGIHPNSASEWSEETRSALEQFVSEHPPVAIGETGLDYFRDKQSRDLQIMAFQDQLSIARAAELPVIIHMRGDVESDMRTILDGQHEPMCVFHSFDGSPEFAQWIVDHGWMIGVGGLMSRRSARLLRDILTTVPAQHLLLETDSPYLSPTGWDHKRNTPESIPIIAAHLARLRGETVEEVARYTTENAERVFGLKTVAPVEETSYVAEGLEA